jgi:hypothetical protein
MTQYLLKAAHRPPLAAGAAFWPLVAGTLVTAVLLGVLFRTRFLPLLAFGGMLLLIAGGVLFAFYLPNSGNAIFLAATGILGLGAGATVTPGLYLAAFSLQIAIIARLFALIELVRSVADFILAPVVVKIAELSSSAMLSASGVPSALWIAVAIAAAGTVLVIALYVLGGTRLIPPAIEAWTAEGKTALHSPPLLAVLRKRRSK